MKRSIILSILCLSFVFAHSVSAVPVHPTLDAVLSDGPGSPLVTDMSLLAGLTERGQNLCLTDLTFPEISVATMLFEEAGYAGSNQFGIYNYNGPGVAPSAWEMLLLFEGSDELPISATVQFDLTNEIAWYDRNSNATKDAGETANMGAVFGAYLTSPDKCGGISNPTFYTDELLNPDTAAIEHGLITTQGISPVQSRATLMLWLPSRIYWPGIPTGTTTIWSLASPMLLRFLSRRRLHCWVLVRWHC